MFLGEEEIMMAKVKKSHRRQSNPIKKTSGVDQISRDATFSRLSNAFQEFEFFLNDKTIDAVIKNELGSGYKDLAKKVKERLLLNM